ncbi:Wadjet anti-phage system protein JetD domain-containing protein [Roseospira visakhapatnamensis]|uniref:Wadjet protein JetD C-terminal domain-containing protein n=1 Tax=Roseospira visakhapatnamensis TaxID=390880 RepID=A0A7W6W910_9PROT|nr:Wadjet anti-phage system protein JetD domain-containing protein [Roseospira visakhapatnamensis]MBB4265414.1 hypothetical protein [Roseospira visakhapatnamensis]
MVKSVVDARAGLDWMLDRMEERPDRDPTRVLVRPDYTAMSLSDDVVRFHALLRQAEEAGALTIEWSRKARDLVDRVRLKDPARLYAFLKRDPTGERAIAILDEVSSELSPPRADLSPLLERVRERWALGRSALGSLKPGDRYGLTVILKCVDAILRDEHLDCELRKFSEKVTGTTKAVERQAPRIGEALKLFFPLPEEARGLEVLAALGLLKYSTPILLKGHLRIRGVGAVSADPLIGIPEEWLEGMSIVGDPPYLMSVENLASFNRYVREVKDNGLVIYTGGFPSRSVAATFRHLDRILPPSVPMFHWGDIDRHGHLIADVIERLLSRPLTRHRMEWARAGDKGSLEQEALDPEAPAWR